MTAYINPAQAAFEQNKDNEQIQALLKALGRLREHVVEWEMTTKTDSTQSSYKVVFSDGSEQHGEIMYAWQNREWIASGKLIPAEIASEMRKVVHP